MFTNSEKNCLSWVNGLSMGHLIMNALFTDTITKEDI